MAFTPPANSGFYRMPLGAFQAIALHDGYLERDRPPGFVRNASSEAVGDAFAQAGMPSDKLTITFTALAIQTPDGVVLIDTGLGANGPATAGHVPANLAAAGIAAADVTAVILSHFHIDHISGLRDKAGAATFPNAQIYVPEAEYAFWTSPERRAAAADALKPNFDLVERLLATPATPLHHYAAGQDILPGFRAIDASGHTPGMCAIEITSGYATLTYVADITNNPLIFARHPDWQAMFDMDPDRAIQTRRRLFDQFAANRSRLFFFHAPFPGFGTIVANGDAYEYLPALWR